MPRLRRRGHVLVARDTPEAWTAYYLGELRARRFPLKLPRRNFYALLGLSNARGQFDHEQGPGWWRKDQEASNAQT